MKFVPFDLPALSAALQHPAYSDSILLSPSLPYDYRTSIEYFVQKLGFLAQKLATLQRLFTRHFLKNCSLESFPYTLKWYPLHDRVKESLDHQALRFFLRYAA